MIPSELLLPKIEKSPIADRAEILARYKQMRLVSTKLNEKLVRRLSNEALNEGGRKLGILQGNKLVFNNQDESSILMDYCIYDVRRAGRNAIDDYLIDSLPDTDSDEMICLRAKQHAIYSLFIVESVERGLGITVRNLKTNEATLIVDLGFSSSAVPGLAFASRLLVHDDFSMTTGAALPIGVKPAGQDDKLLEELAAAMKPDHTGYFDPAKLIRPLLRSGASSHVQYEDPGQGSSPAQRSARVGRNEVCPCGSGRKYKQCCLNKG